MPSSPSCRSGWPDGLDQANQDCTTVLSRLCLLPVRSWTLHLASRDPLVGATKRERTCDRLHATLLLMAATATTEPATRAEMSLAGWAALPEDDEGELVDGQLVEEEVSELNHESIVAWLLVVLWSWAVPRGGFVFGSEIKLAVRPRRGRKPDLSVYLPGGPIPRRRATCGVTASRSRTNTLGSACASTGSSILRRARWRSSSSARTGDTRALSGPRRGSSTSRAATSCGSTSMRSGPKSIGLARKATATSPDEALGLMQQARRRPSSERGGHRCCLRRPQVMKMELSVPFLGNTDSATPNHRAS